HSKTQNVDHKCEYSQYQPPVVSLRFLADITKKNPNRSKGVELQVNLVNAGSRQPCVELVEYLAGARCKQKHQGNDCQYTSHRLVGEIREIQGIGFQFEHFPDNSRGQS